MMSLRVDIKNKEPEIIEVAEHITAENWLAAVRRSDGKYVTLNTTSYLKEDIVGVTELKTRHGFTNTEGI